MPRSGPQAFASGTAAERVKGGSWPPGHGLENSQLRVAAPPLQPEAAPPLLDDAIHARRQRRVRPGPTQTPTSSRERRVLAAFTRLAPFFSKPLAVGVAFLLFALASRAAPPKEDDVPPAVRSFSASLPRLFEEFERLVAREEMRQEAIDPRASRTLRRRILVSDYQIARLERDPNALWEFRFVREVDGKPVPGAERQLADFLRLRHRDTRAERLSIVDLARGQSLPNCYWHNLTLVLFAYTEPHLENFRWRARGDRYEFEQVRGLGIPDDFFDVASTRHYPTGALTLGGPNSSLSSLELRFPTRDTEVVMTLTFAAQRDSQTPMPARYVVERKRASTGRTLFRTTIEYSNYRRFTVTTEEETSRDGSR
jgi:hypothetical protein